VAVIDVSYGSLVGAPKDVARAATLLDAAERDRARSFRFERDRRRFIVRRARLREVLGAASGRDPRDLDFATNEYGKPVLLGSQLCFSASHSAERWLVAVGMQELGVDCERIDPQIDWRGIGRSLFGPCEVAALEACRPDMVIDAFFSCWARKEAFVKALGVGLSYPLDAFEVSVTPEAALLAGCMGWAITSLAVGPEYRAALVVKDDGSPIDVRLHPEG
jgi:4'-phosphopantetheinyl transferase